MIINILKKEIIEEDNSKIFEKLLNDFNQEAKKLKLKYRLEFNEDKIFMAKQIFLSFGSSIPECYIGYNKTGDYFFFDEGVAEDIFNEAKEIFSKLNQKFLIEVIQ